MKKVLVTGANGYLGKGIVKKLLDEGMSVVATDFRDEMIDRRAIIKSANLFDIEDPYTYFEQPNIVLHLAWRDGFVHSSDNHINDLSKHYSFLKRICASDVEQVAVMGSMHEIGFFEGSITDNTPCNPQSLYGISKNALRNMAELLCKEHNKVFQWLRGFYIVGNTLDGCSIFSKIMQAADSGKEEFPFTMGLNQFDFLDYEDFCRLVVHTVMQTEVNGVINICSGRPERLSDRVERFITENSLHIKLKYGAFPDRPYDSKAVWGDDFKIRMIEKLSEFDR